MALIVQKNFFATDENGNEVFIMKGDSISEIMDAGPILSENSKNAALYDPDRKVWYRLDGWNVSFKFTPTHKQWAEVVTADAVKVLKALEG